MATASKDNVLSVGSTTVVRPPFPVVDGGSNPASTLQSILPEMVVIPTSRFDSGPDVDQMVRERHYLRRWPGVVVKVFRLEFKGVPVGVCVYALPPRETNKRYGVSCGWELARLWISDSMPTNGETWFIARTIAWIKRNHPEVECLISYADPSVGHTGLIYRAGNWKADGMTDDGRKSPRCDYVFEGKRYSRMGHLPPGAKPQRIPRVRKYRYVYFLTPSRH